MKKLLLSCLLLAIGSGAYAQATCAAAVNITANATFTAGTITGTYSNPCLGGTTASDGTTAIKALWWKYTPTANGEITLSSVLAANPAASTDTRVSILKGTCALLTCVGYNDDITGTDYRSTVTVPVAAGTTYYIEWDNYWAATGFQFSFAFVATPCVRPGSFDFFAPGGYTETDANVGWVPSIGAPAAYDVDWSINFADVAGIGTIVAVPAGTSTTQVVGTLAGLPANQNFRYFVRSNCGATQSAWAGPNYGYLAVVLPYSNTFDDATKNNTDGFRGFSLLSSSTTAAPPISDDSGTGSLMFSGNSTTAVSNRWAYSRALSLSAGEQVTLNFKTKLYATGTTVVSPMTMNVTVGNAQTTATQTTVVGSVTASTDTSYTAQSVVWTAPTAGIYYFGFNNNSPIGTTQTYLFFDTLDISSVLSTNSFIASKLNVYPNPSSSTVNISSDVNAIISTIEMLDLNGRVIKSQKINATEGQISVSDLATGMYMMKITTDQGVATKKIVKQ